MATDTHTIELVDLRKLTVQQQNAIDLLVTGCSDKEAADKLGLNRSTVTRWRLYHPAFKAELNAQREAVWGTAKEKLRGLVLDAIELLAQEMNRTDSEDRIEIAMSLLKLVRIGEGLSPSGLTEAEEIIKKEAKTDPLAAYTTPAAYEIEAYEVETLAAINDTDEEAVWEAIQTKEDAGKAAERARKKAIREAKRASRAPGADDVPLNPLTPEDRPSNAPVINEGLADPVPPDAEAPVTVSEMETKAFTGEGENSPSCQHLIAIEDHPPVKALTVPPT